MIYQLVNILFKTSVIRSYLCGYSDAYIVVKGKIDLVASVANKNDKTEKDIVFKINAPFRSCFSQHIDRQYRSLYSHTDL